MSHDSRIRPDDILSEQELESLRLAQELYTIRAKQGAANLAQVLELGPEVRDQILGSLATRLAYLDFEQRRDIAIRFSEISIILGGVGTVAETVSLSVVTGPQPESGLEDGDNGAAPTAEADQDSVELGKSQVAWLARVYGEAVAQKLAALPQDRFDEFLTNLTEHYLTLKIARITAEGKIQRVMQLKQFMGGKDYMELARELDVNPRTLWGGLAKMAEGIAKRTDREDLLALIPRAQDIEADDEQDIDEDLGLEETAVPLSKEQQRWVLKLVQDEAVVEQVDALGPSQRNFLAERLSHHLTPAMLRRFGPDMTRSRVDVMVKFVEGADLAQIAAERYMSVEAIRDYLLHAANRLKSTVDHEKLVALVSEAQNFTPAEPTEE